jgi:hypothetical protein
MIGFVSIALASSLLAAQPATAFDTIDPKDERVQALVAYFAKNGFKLVANGSEWQITEPKHDDGAISVSIRPFPATATEKEMRDRLAMINLAYELNPSAHLAMSYLILRDAKKGKTADVTALEAKLMKLFRAYRPAAKPG